MVPALFRHPLTYFIAGASALAILALILIPATASDMGQAQLVAETVAPEASAPELDSAVSAARPTGRGVSTVVVPGRGESEIVDRVVVVTGPVPGQHVILWLGANSVQIQMLTPPPEVASRTLHGPGSVVTHALQGRTPEGQRELGIVYDATALGSGSPTARFAVLRLEGGVWRMVWDSGADEDWRGAHGRVEFPADDLSELVVRSDSFLDGHDELSDVLHESNSGPHRYFVDRWTRAGDAYVLASAETVPEPYATLVEYLYALSTGDDSAARELVTSDGLVSDARAFGMDDAPGKYWSVTCDDGLECGKEEPIRFDPTRYHGEPPVAVYFKELDGRWLISDIRPD